MKTIALLPRVDQTLFLIIMITGTMTGCANLQVDGLVAKQTTAHAVYFQPLVYDAIQRPISLITPGGQIISQVVTPRGPILFRLPQTQQAYRYSNECLQIHSGTGEILKVIGVDSLSFQLPVWRAALRNIFGTRELREEQRQTQINLNNDKKRLLEAKNWIRINPSIHAEGACIRPPHGPMPKEACDSSEAALLMAQSQCKHELQCPALGMVTGSALKKEVGDRELANIADLLVTHGCVADIMQSRGESFFKAENLGQLFGLWILESSVRNMLINNGVSEEAAALAAKGALVFLSYKMCLKKEENSCNQKYTAWLHAPELAEMACFSHRKAESDLPQRIASNEQRLFAIKDEIAAIQTAARHNQRTVSIESCR